MKIIIDAFGGDYAPLEIIHGSAMAVEEFGVEILLVGNKEKILSCIVENQISDKNFSYLDCDEVISMEDHPESILREKKNCTMAVALRALADGEGDALVSAGNTGALVVGSTLYVKRIKGIKRAALAPLLPTDTDHDVLIMDSGANVECTPEMLCQFAVMANEYAKDILGLTSPRVGLLNIGTEDTKGSALQTAAFEQLKNMDMNFIGNVEARDVLPGICDIVIADGFSGNIFLKASEGAVGVIMHNIKRILKKNALTKMAAVPLMAGLKAFAKKMDYTERGGAPLLGIAKPVVKAHGNSKAKAFKCGIKQAIDYAQSGVIQNISNVLKAKTDE